ncbi:MAG: amidase family protein [Candidatus Hinthialibacter antarcticus]|nr:amidase family protein [Candidatus Hinthialibacter antarcticus]
MNDLVRMSAREIAQAIRNKEISSRDITEACIQKIEAVNPKLNAVVQPCYERALEQAVAADQTVAHGDALGALHGVPFTMKDSIETEGLTCVCGTEGRKNFVPKQDAVLVKRLRDAGAILLGKTNVPEICMAFESDNVVFGKTNNPYNINKSSGGSSGGEAAIIAACGSPFGLGSDAGGSIRFPSHACGIAGLKPTTARLPRTGHYIPPGGALGPLWQIGPMARTAKDLAYLFPLLLGDDPGDPAIVPMPYLDGRSVEIRKLKIAYYTDNGVVTPTQETQQTVKSAAECFAQLGAEVIEARPACFGREADIWLDLCGVDGGELLKQVLQQSGTKNFAPIMQRLLDICQTRKRDANGFHHLLFEWQQFKQSVYEFMQGYDLIVCPTCATSALDHGVSYNDDVFPGFSYTIAYNLSGLPGAVVRGGESKDGLPIGVQLIAKPWREDVALAAAIALEEATGGWKAPTGV